MTKRQNFFARNTLILAVAATLVSLPVMAQDFDKIEIKVTKVGGSVYMLEGAGGNIGVSAGDDGILIIDDQFAPLAPKIRTALKGISDKPLRFVLNTHYHGDHTGGNATFGADAPIIAQTNVRKRLAAGSTAAGRETPPAPAVALPVITFDDKVSVHFNGEEIRAVHIPHGHTDGDSVIFFPKSNVVHMGDDFFNGMFPFVDIDNGGSVRGMAAGVEKVLTELPSDVKVIPGHGKLSDKEGLKKFGEMLKATTKVVADGLKAGKTAAQLKSDKVLEPWAAWATSFMRQDKFIDTLVKELTQK